MKKLPLGIQTFREIINSNYLYVDKTEYIYNLINEGKYYFISRPRRFGKSLLISTLKEIFSGNKELFKDLWIYYKIKWEEYPVIHIDFSTINYRDDQKEFQKSIKKSLTKTKNEYNLNIDDNLNCSDYFKEIILQLSNINKVVILIDEYDKPIIDFVDDIEKANKNREILKSFYTIIKGSDQYIKFAILTGVSKFSKVSVFSGLNNIRDITLSESFCKLLGYTQEELELYFQEYIDLTSKEFNISKIELLDSLKKLYNGYSWNGKDFVYNPFSILYFFTEKQFGNYWFTSGTPTFLINIIKERNIDIKEFDNLSIDEELLNSFELDKINIKSLLFQTGYLTIKKVNNISITTKEYILNYPNKEVENSFLKSILNELNDKNGENGVIINKLVSNINNNNLEEFFTNMRSLFADIPNQIFLKDKEAYYQTVIYIILKLLGIHIQVEINTNVGRIDGVIHTKERIYIIEFKIGKAEEGLKQIEENKYYEKYLSLNKKIILIAIP